MAQKIRPTLASALAQVDPANEAHWTADGQVRVDVINAMLDSLEAGYVVARQDIIEAAPTFMRSTAGTFMADYEAARGVATEALHRGSPLAGLHEEVAPPAGATASITGLPGVHATPKPSVLRLPLLHLLTSPDKLRDALTELDLQSQALLQKRRELDDELASIGQKAELCSRQLSRIEPKEDPSKGIRDYLRQQRRVRAERVGRARAFVAAGTNAQAVAHELRGPSQLDAAMSRRRPGFGAQRPALRMPIKPIGEVG